jgi:hypothetical protein
VGAQDVIASWIAAAIIMKRPIPNPSPSPHPPVAARRIEMGGDIGPTPQPTVVRYRTDEILARLRAAHRCRARVADLRALSLSLGKAYRRDINTSAAGERG